MPELLEVCRTASGGKPDPAGLLSRATTVAVVKSGGSSRTAGDVAGTGRVAFGAGHNATSVRFSG